MSSYKLQKLKIVSEKDDTFEVMFNPESYLLVYKNRFSPVQSPGTSGKEQTYSKSEPAKLYMTVVFDSTGASGIAKDLKDKVISDEVDRFLQITARIDGEKHRPLKVFVEWGKRIFEGYLEDAKINYTLFDRDGNPLRAELNVCFAADIDDDRRVKQEDLKSSDLTHSKAVSAGDNLPLLSNKIYGDPGYYIHIARINGIDNFRKLEPGTVLSFPPI